MDEGQKRLPIRFYQSASGREPVREWLKSLSLENRKILGTDIRALEFGWPIGMPLCRALGNGLWEVRSSLPRGRIARVIFFIHEQYAVLLHGFLKKTQKTPKPDIKLAPCGRTFLIHHVPGSLPTSPSNMQPCQRELSHGHLPNPVSAHVWGDTA